MIRRKSSPLKYWTRAYELLLIVFHSNRTSNNLYVDVKIRQKNDTYFEQMTCRRSRMFDMWADPKYFILSNCITAKPHFSKYFNTRIYALTRFVVAGILMKRKKHITVKNGTLYSNFSPVKEIIHIITLDIAILFLFLFLAFFILKVQTLNLTQAFVFRK